MLGTAQAFSLSFVQRRTRTTAIRAQAGAGSRPGKTLKILLRPLLAAAGRSSVPAGNVAPLRAGVARLLLALVLASGLPAVALAASGERTGPAAPALKALGDSLTYDNFTNFNCSQLGFVAKATAHLDIAGPIHISGVTTLDGIPYDTYSLDDPGGPDQFETEFSRDFTPPPPGSATYTFVFRSNVFQNGQRLGISQTTITCANSVFSAVNVWLAAGEPIPAGQPAGWAALALLLAAAAAVRLAPRRA